MPGRWMWIDGSTRVRRCDDGEWQGQKFENVQTSLRAKQEMRKATAKNGRLARGKGSDSDFHVIASLPETVVCDRFRTPPTSLATAPPWLAEFPETVLPSIDIWPAPVLTTAPPFPDGPLTVFPVNVQPSRRTLPPLL